MRPGYTLAPSILALLLTPLSLGLLGIDACGNPSCDDADADGVCDSDDVCPNADDGYDPDLDGIPEACDPCPADPRNDSDLDDICDGQAVVSFDQPVPRDFAILARGSDNTSLLELAGQAQRPDYTSARLEVLRDGQSFYRTSVPLSYSGEVAHFSFSTRLPAGLNEYQLELYLEAPGLSTLAFKRQRLAVGDLIFIQGQSNAVAGDYYAEHLANQYQSPWIRSFGSATVDPVAVAGDLVWDLANGENIHDHAAVGTWGLRLARNLLDRYKLPIGILNGAVGGTLISQHQRNDAEPEDLDTIYGRFLFRARQSGMRDHARYLVWYQGESDGYGAGADSNAMHYLERFDALRSDWKADFKSLEQFYVFQVRNGCGIDHPRDGGTQLYFMDAAGSLLGFDQADVFMGSTWGDVSLAGQAPTGTTLAMVAFYTWQYGALVFDDASLVDQNGMQRVFNPGFEDGGTVNPSLWQKNSGGSYSWVSSPVHGGVKAMQVDYSSNLGLMYQTLSARGGETFTYSIWSQAGVLEPYLDVREVLRELPVVYSDVQVMSTNAAPQHDGCHFYFSGYKELGDRITRLVSRDYYGDLSGGPIEAPDALEAHFLNATTVEVSVAGGVQGLAFEAGSSYDFRVDGARVIAGQVAGSSLILTLDRAPLPDATLSYYGRYGDGPDIVNGVGVGLLAFYMMPID